MDTYKNLRYNYGGEGFAINGCYNFYIDNVYGRVGGIHGDTTTSVSGKHFPKGGANSPYRLSDFRNYNSKAASNTFLTSLPQFYTGEVYYSSTPKFNCVLYKNTNVDDNTNLTMDDIITDLSLAWSFGFKFVMIHHIILLIRFIKIIMLVIAKNQQIMYMLVEK